MIERAFSKCYSWNHLGQGVNYATTQDVYIIAYEDLDSEKKKKIGWGKEGGKKRSENTADTSYQQF